MCPSGSKRVKRICDDKEEYEKERSKIKERLTQRGYNSNLIEKQMLKVDELDRKETLKYRKKHKNKKMEINTQAFVNNMI